MSPTRFSSKENWYLNDKRTRAIYEKMMRIRMSISTEVQKYRHEIVAAGRRGPSIGTGTDGLGGGGTATRIESSTNNDGDITTHQSTSGIPAVEL